ncbi:GlsB/YeaQ/YmgE family stress response membrane protein [Azotosporobacter soli]|uniref:GlsB/YeaQ/YmgE family stress response membrane protein n=1 Tax=Azotosporobacter soli TaxID=3055040 RepID=UPI0031FE9CED
MLWPILIGILSGWLAGNIMRGSGFGLIGDLLVGIAGSFIGSYLFTFFGLTAYGAIGEVIMATLGAIAMLAVIRFL